MSLLTKPVVLAVGVVATAVALVLSMWVLPQRAADTGARAAAQLFVDRVAAGDPDEMEQLWAMTASESPGALRTAGQLLVTAEERIEIVSIGGPEAVDDNDRPNLGSSVALDDFVSLTVHYRLDGEEREWPIVMGKPGDASGNDAEDWRVATPMLGSITWSDPGEPGLMADYYVDTTRQVRRPFVYGGSTDDQPLYPAAYRTQARLDPYFTSAPTTVVVTPGEPVDAPGFEVTPTPATRELVAKEIGELIAKCSGTEDLLRCPLYDAVDLRGVEPYEDDWWRGLEVEPTVEIADDGSITVSGGVMRFVGPDGQRTMTFGGSGRTVIDSVSQTPRVYPLDLQETG